MGRWGGGIYNIRYAGVSGAMVITHRCRDSGIHVYSHIFNDTIPTIQDCTYDLRMFYRFGTLSGFHADKERLDILTCI